MLIAREREPRAKPSLCLLLFCSSRLYCVIGSRMIQWQVLLKLDSAARIGSPDNGAIVGWEVMQSAVRQRER